MSALVLKSFFRLYKLLKVYLTFAFIGILLALGYAILPSVLLALASFLPTLGYLVIVLVIVVLVFVVGKAILTGRAS